MQENKNLNPVVEEEGFDLVKIVMIFLTYWKLFLVSVIVDFSTTRTPPIRAFHLLYGWHIVKSKQELNFTMPRLSMSTDRASYF